MTDTRPLNLIRDIGEQGLLAKLQSFCPPEVIGDDAALLTIAPDHQLVITTDMLVDGLHFSVGIANPGVHTMSAADVGWRSVAANLSDLAAMGADPVAVTVSLGLPGNLPVTWVEHLYLGMAECLQPHGVIIAGGDICQSPVITISITAVGQIMSHQAILRSAAQPGDAIVATGLHGLSRAGLELLLHPESGSRLSEGDRAQLIRAHQRPCPRLDVRPVLQQIGALDETPVRIAGMDSSDGLADAVLQLCRASTTGAQIDRANILIPQALKDWITAETALKWALYGGEDFELILCLPPDRAHPLIQKLGGQAAIIGKITTQTDVILIDSTGHYPDQILTLSQGFQHF